MDTTNEHLNTIRAYIAEGHDTASAMSYAAALAGYDPDKEFGQDARDDDAADAGDAGDDFESRRDPAHVYLPGDEDDDDGEDADEDIQDIPLSALYINPDYQPRRNGLDAENLDSLRASDPATWPPLLVMPAESDEDGQEAYLVVDGYHRLHIAEEKGLMKLPCRVLDDVDDSNALDVAFSMNLAHGKGLKTADRKAYAHKLYKRSPEMTYRAIARQCGLAPNTVIRLLDVQNEQQAGSKKPKHKSEAGPDDNTLTSKLSHMARSTVDDLLGSCSLCVKQGNGWLGIGDAILLLQRC